MSPAQRGEQLRVALGSVEGATLTVGTAGLNRRDAPGVPAAYDQALARRARDAQQERGGGPAAWPRGSLSGSRPECSGGGGLRDDDGVELGAVGAGGRDHGAVATTSPWRYFGRCSRGLVCPSALATSFSQPGLLT